MRKPGALAGTATAAGVERNTNAHRPVARLTARHPSPGEPPRSVRPVGLAIALAASAPPAHAADPTTCELLARIAALEQRLAAVRSRQCRTSRCSRHPMNSRAAPALWSNVRNWRPKPMRARRPRHRCSPSTRKCLSVGNRRPAILKRKLRGLAQGDAAISGGDYLRRADRQRFLLRRVEPTRKAAGANCSIGFA